VPDEVIYRCIHAACARTLPRRVNFCPYCGTGQHADLDKPGHAPVRAIPVPPAPVPPAPPLPVPLPPPPPVPPPAPPPPVAAAPAPPPVQAAPRAGLAAPPPRREPLRLRWWALAFALLWGIWITAKPTAKKIDARIDQAIALSKECKSGEAQAELIALRSSKATPEQLLRLQQAINAEAPLCDKRQKRGKAWSETQAAVDAALNSTAPDKAKARLAAFVKQWGADKDTRELARKIEERKGGSADAQTARNLIAEGGQALSLGDYRTAIDKMEVCAAMVEGGNSECAAMQARAERLQAQMMSCTKAGREWIADRCQ
jgi:hypothetical protein